MKISSYNTSPYFSGTLCSNKALREVRQYAAEHGKSDLFNMIKLKVKDLPEHNIRFIHHYHKNQDLCKTQIKYTRNGFENTLTEIDKSYKNPAELSLTILEDLLNSNSALFQKIYG